MEFRCIIVDAQTDAALALTASACIGPSLAQVLIGEEPIVQSFAILLW